MSKRRRLSFAQKLKVKVHLMTAKTKNGLTTPLVSANEKISIQLIDDFPNHPYYVFDDEDMFELTESIRKKV